MTISMAAFVVNDAILKSSGTDVGVFQSIFVRGIFAGAVLFIAAIMRGAFAQTGDFRANVLIGWRTLAEIAATFSFVTALFNLPLANATAIMQTTPIVMAVGAALVFKERITARQTVAIVIGFIGVLLIIRPSSGDFNIFVFFCLLAVLCSVIRDLIVRNLTAEVSSLFIAFIATASITVVSGCFMVLTQTWVPLTALDVLLFAVAAVFLSVGYFCAVAAMRVGVMAYVSAFRYTVLLWAALLGWLVFSDIPSLWTVLGMVVIVLSGLLLVSQSKPKAS